MIGHYLSNNNEMWYSTKTNNFSPTKQGSTNNFEFNIKVIVIYAHNGGAYTVATRMFLFM